jgi:hypothetical protein
MDEMSQDDLKIPEKLAIFLREITQVIPNFIETQLETVKDLPVVTELQVASTKMISALDSGNHETAFEYWQKFFDKYEQIRVAYHEAAHAVVGYRLKSKFNRKILRVCINAQTAKARGLYLGFVDFENIEPKKQIEAQANLAIILAGCLNEPHVENNLGGKIEKNLWTQYKEMKS